MCSVLLQINGTTGAPNGVPISNTIYFGKTCPFYAFCPADCSGHGTCLVDHSAQTAACQCTAGYELLPDCSLGFSVSRNAICPGQPFTVSWDTRRLSFGVAYNDWIAVLPPVTGITTWTVADANREAFSSLTGNYGMYSWSYLNGDSSGPEEAIQTGSFPIVIHQEDLDGAFGISFNIADEYESTAIRTVQMLSKYDAQCVNASAPDAPRNRSDCNGHGEAIAGACHCDLPYFGNRCQSGCAELSEYTAFGTDISSSTSDPTSKEFLNNQLCKYVLAPVPSSPSQPVTGITLSFRSLSMEAGTDFVTVYKGNSTAASAQYTLLTGLFSGTVSIPTPTATIVFKTSRT